MEKEKQIEEMIKITDSHNCPKGQCFKFGYSCNRCKIETLVNAGYGNVKEAVKEFAEKLKEKVEKAEEEIVPKGCDSYFKNGAMCCQSIIFLILDELVKEVCGD